jgi:hypothetical protein
MKIKPCKCGGNGELTRSYSTNSKHGYLVRCENHEHNGPQAKTIKGAIMLWNKWQSQNLSVDEIFGAIRKGWTVKMAITLKPIRDRIIRETLATEKTDPLR